MAKNEISVIIFGRCVKRDDICSIGPAPGQTTTYEQEFAKPGRYHRNDIALVNVFYANGSHDQWAINPTREGKPRYPVDCERYFTDEEKYRLIEENRKMIELAKEWPEFGKAMRLT